MFSAIWETIMTNILSIFVCVSCKIMHVCYSTLLLLFFSFGWKSLLWSPRPNPRIEKQPRFHGSRLHCIAFPSPFPCKLPGRLFSRTSWESGVTILGANPEAKNELLSDQQPTKNDCLAFFLSNKNFKRFANNVSSWVWIVESQACLGAIENRDCWSISDRSHGFTPGKNASHSWKECSL